MDAMTGTAMKRTAAAVVSVLLAAGCSSFRLDEEPTDSGVPDHDASITAPGEVDVLTDATDPADLRAVFDDVRGRRTESHAWHVTIRCASVPDLASTDPLLATGRFANTQQGLAETGLETTDDVAFETTGRTDCTPLAPTTPGAVTPDEVIAAVETAGLPAPNPRDASNFCAKLECLQRTATDSFAVIVWPTPEAATRWAESFPLDAVRVGPVTTIQFMQGELIYPYHEETPTRDAYIAAVAPLGD